MTFILEFGGGAVQDSHHARAVMAVLDQGQPILGPKSRPDDPALAIAPRQQA